jgi:ribose 5-phosphate isomerase RpiB
MKIAIGVDGYGYELKETVLARLRSPMDDIAELERRAFKTS